MNGFTATADVELLGYVSAVSSDHHIKVDIVKDKDKGLVEED
jgi:hypothetical protein